MTSAAAVSSRILQAPAPQAMAPARRSGVFTLFVLLTGTIFTRPSEIVPGLQGVPIYELLIVSCILICLPRILEQVTLRSLVANPITFCVVGLLVSVVLSRLSHLAIADTIDKGWTFTKMLLYYLLLVSVLDCPEKLRSFLLWLVGWMVILATLPVLQYHGLVDLSFLAPLKELDFDHLTGQELAVTRLIGIGIYADPNDLAHILAAGVPICLYALSDRRSGSSRYVWLAPLGLFLYAIMLTKSRGGLIALVTGMGTFAVLRYGWRKALWLGLLAMPALVLLSDRQTDISTDEQTGQERIQMWSDAMVAFRANPLFGLGAWQFGGENSLVAHNSYIQAFAELGLLGGTCFLGTYYLSLHAVGWLARQPAPPMDSRVVPLLPCLCGSIAAYAAGMLTLTRNFLPPTYLFPGLATVCLGFMFPIARQSMQRVDLPLMRRLLAISLAFVVVAYVFIRLSVRW
ncbi:MAG TPA: O-antigen ligase family protein [Tepidisphaeraceae bacterium]|nr:O-antigen ligase family protein [Tepidisphaeraceae bacterium]